MLGARVTASPAPQPPIEHLQGLDALPRVAEALARFEPAVLLSADGRGAIYAPPASTAEFFAIASGRVSPPLAN